MWTPSVPDSDTSALDPLKISFHLMLPRLKWSILTGKLQWDAHICGNPTPLCLPLSLHLMIHLCHHGLPCTANYFPSVCLPTASLKQFALTTATAFAVLNLSVIDFYTPYLRAAIPFWCPSPSIFNLSRIFETSLSNINTNMPQSSICAVYKKTVSETVDVQTRTSLVTEFISLLPYLSEGNGSFPSTSETIQYTTHFFHSTDSLPVIKIKKEDRGTQAAKTQQTQLP